MGERGGDNTRADHGVSSPTHRGRRWHMHLLRRMRRHVLRLHHLLLQQLLEDVAVAAGEEVLRRGGLRGRKHKEDE